MIENSFGRTVRGSRRSTPAGGRTAGPDNRRSEWEEFPNLEARLPQLCRPVAATR